MNIDDWTNENFQSKWMRASDVHGPTTVTITDVKEEQIPDRDTNMDVPTLVLHLTNFKPYILRTKTNIQMLRAFFGPDTEKWKGREVTVWIDPETGLGPECFCR